MITLLIGDTDLNFAKLIISNVVRKNNNIRLVDIVTSNKEAASVIQKYKPHIFLVNTDVIDIDKLKKMEAFPKCIGFTDNEDKSIVHKYFLKTCNMQLVNKKLNHMIEENNFCETKEKIIKDFTFLKFNLSRSGTKYLMESIIYSYEHKNEYLHENLEKNIYPVIAKKFKTNSKHVKWVIIKSINEMYDRNNYERSLDNISDYFYYSNHIKPTAKVILSTMLTKLGA